MKNKNTDTIISRHAKLIFACAWCPASSHTPLKKGEAYTHGICAFHKTLLLSQVTIFRKTV
ncbi:MAG TPA: hypothetical protein VLF68_04630 [Candidatus Saccharimonadales bacterium]|nr:hypothetical protein [Candidatus Saccharimonadales bacterium]